MRLNNSIPFNERPKSALTLKNTTRKYHVKNCSSSASSSSGMPGPFHFSQSTKFNISQPWENSSLMQGTCKVHMQLLNALFLFNTYRIYKACISHHIPKWLTIQYLNYNQTRFGRKPSIKSQTQPYFNILLYNIGRTDPKVKASKKWEHQRFKVNKDVQGSQSSTEKVWLS